MNGLELKQGFFKADKTVSKRESIFDTTCCTVITNKCCDDITAGNSKYFKKFPLPDSKGIPFGAK